MDKLYTWVTIFFFVEYYLFGTRQVSSDIKQRKVIVTVTSDEDEDFTECGQRHSTNREHLPSAC